MRKRTRGGLWALILTLAVGLASVRTLDAADNNPVWRTGISYERLSRTITWDGGASQSKLKADLITAREAIELKPGLAFELMAGLSLSNFNGLAFANLPISLDYEAGAAKGLLLGAGVRARLLTFGNFEIEGVGRFVYSLGFKTTWPLQGFAVPGNATGRPAWLEGSGGARLSYGSSGRFVPYAVVQASFFSGSFAMDEILGDLTGHEAKKLKSKNLLEVTLGADFRVAERLTLRAEAGILPYAGAVDGVASAGFLYRF
jgi:hypothetical protein